MPASTEHDRRSVRDSHLPVIPSIQNGTFLLVRPGSPPLLVLVLLFIVLAACTSSREEDGASGGETTPAPRPVPSSALNVVVVLVDDATDISCADMDEFMPKMSRLLRDRGRCFENATVSSPACCPARAVLQTSQFGHNSGVARQVDAPKLRVEDTIQDDLTRAGWNTYGTGKFFNGVSPWLFESGKKSSGFLTSDFWGGMKYYDYELWDDEIGDHRRPDDRVNATSRTGQFLRSFIASQDGERPFYAYAAFKTPHTDNSAKTELARLPTPTERNRQRPVPPFKWRPEADLRDKLGIYRKKLESKAYYQRLYTARTRAMYDVDDEMGATFDLLRRQGVLDSTAIFLTSDNGYHLGENGWETKGDPYPAAIDVPLLAWYPPAFGTGVVDRRPVGLIDISPTIYDLVDVDPEHVVDGYSLALRRTRSGTFFELQNEQSKILYREAGYYPGRVPTWAMYRRGRASYVEYYDKTNKRIRSEFYRDSRMEENLLWPGFSKRRPSAATLRFFRTALSKGRTCAGTSRQDINPCP